MKSKASQLVKPIVVLTLIAAVMAALLGGTDFLTRGRIAALAEQNEKSAVSKVIEAESYERREITLDGTAYSYYAALSGSDCVGYAFTVSHNGYGGQVSAVVGIRADGHISAVEITDVSGETPGLGQNAKKESFTEQFKEANSPLTVVKSSPGENEISAVTGATITSRAVASAVNSALELFEAVSKEASGQ